VAEGTVQPTGSEAVKAAVPADGAVVPAPMETQDVEEEDTAQQQREVAEGTESLVGAAVFEESTARAHGPLDYKRAAALRVKYRVKAPDGSGKHRQPPTWVGHHPRNRDRTRMSSERCEELMESLLGQFDGEEADHDSVCVEQAPGSQTTTQWTQETCDPEETMANVVPHMLKDGSIGHSHLNQCLANLLGGAKVTRPGLQKFVDANGRLSISMVKARDPECAQYAVQGLLWERLSHDIETEEPDGITLISSLLNRKRDMAMVEHEIQVLNRLANIVDDFSKTSGGNITVVMARNKLAAEGMPQVAHSAEFPEVLWAVFQWGGAESVHFKRLKEFHERCVNAKLRRVRLSFFIALGGIDVAFPLTRNLCAEFAYSASADKNQLEDGYCNKIKITHINVVKSPARISLLKAMEKHLERFHSQYRDAGVYQEISPSNLTKLMCTVDLMMAPPLFFEKRVEDALKEIDVCATQVETALRRSLTPRAIQRMEKRCPPKARASEPKKEAALTLQPKVIQYDAQGKAQNRQDEQTQSTEPLAFLEVPFVESLCSPTIEDWKLKVRLLQALAQALKDVGNNLRADVKVMRQTTLENLMGHGSAPVCVKAKRTLLAGELVLLPLVRGIEFIVAAKTSLSPMSVQTSSLTNDGGHISIIPCIQWNEKQPFLPPFWLLKRSKDSQEVNVQIKEMSVSLLAECKVDRASGSGEQQSVRTTQREDIHVPYLTNIGELEAGTELVAFLQMEKKEVKKQAPQTWLTMVKKDPKS